MYAVLVWLKYQVDFTPYRDKFKASYLVWKEGDVGKSKA